jgi:plastocyanin
LAAPISGVLTGTKKTSHRPIQWKLSKMQIQTALLQLHKDDTVRFINRDMVAHTATEATNKRWSSPARPSDSSWKVAVQKSAGYYCTIHPVMKGKIVVQG